MMFNTQVPKHPDLKTKNLKQFSMIQSKFKTVNNFRLMGPRKSGKFNATASFNTKSSSNNRNSVRLFTTNKIQQLETTQTKSKNDHRRMTKVHFAEGSRAGKALNLVEGFDLGQHQMLLHSTQ